MTALDNGFSLPKIWPAFIILPLAAFLLSNFVLANWAPASFELAQPWLADGHAEASGRLRVLATFLLFVAFAAASVIYFVLVLRRLRRRHLWRLCAAYAVTLVSTASAIGALNLDKGDAYFENDFVCLSLERLHPPTAKAGAVPDYSTRASPKPGGEASLTATGRKDSGEDEPPPRVAASSLSCPLAVDAGTGLPTYRPGGNNYFRNFRILSYIAALFFLMAAPAQVWGAVACLAMPESGQAADVYAAWVRQTQRLNQLLYLTAGSLIVGLFFTSARLNWPAFSLHPADLPAYSAHARSYVFYIGIINSILIASYYLPVAAALARLRPARPVPVWAIARGVRPPDGEEKPDPFGAYRVALTILSPAILGLLGELLKFSP
ncbi:MAG: hypothetical protein QOJ27_973 [Sphingomonadales bacterium]|nr:hypothetical protein [Sphingomonadales bacterium]